MKRTIGMIAAPCVAAALLFGAVATHAQNLLVNPDFESGLTGWTTFGNASSASDYAQSGSGALKLFGNWWYQWNATGAYQNIPFNAGDQLTLQGYGFNPSADGVTGANQNFALMKIIWFDGPNGTGNMLQPLAGPGALFGDNPGIESGRLDNATPQGQWVALTASGIAPAGTQSVQILGGLFLQPNWEGGALWFDNLSATATAVPEPATLSLLGLAALGALALRRR